MRKLKKFFKQLLFIIIINALFILPSFGAVVYYDTYEHWAVDDINFASNTIKVFKGYGDLTFRPEQNITRAEFITILSKTAYLQNKMSEVYKGNMPYNDFTHSHWSYTFVLSMYDYMKSNGNYSFEDIFEGNKFYPNQPITRYEAASLTAALCDVVLYDNLVTFTDVPSDYKFFDSIKKLHNANIIKGYENNTFNGDGKITRAESAALINRIYNELKTGNKNNYLNKFEFATIKGDTILYPFGTYDYNTTDANDKRFLKAKDSLEYISFGGYVNKEDSHLYDLDPLETMNSLRLGGYYNVSGTNFYLLKFGTFSDAEATKLCNEILANIIARGQMKDAEYMQLFTIVSKYNVTDHLMVKALEKWYGYTKDNNAKLNILTFRYNHYVKTNNIPMLKVLVYDDLKKSNNMYSIISMINWNLQTTEEINFKNFMSNYNYQTFSDISLDDFINNPPIDYHNSNIIKLNNLLLVENTEKQSYPLLKGYEEVFFKYSLNRIYVLNFIGEKDRAFIEALNDYEIVKTLSIYNTKKVSIDENYIGALKKIKY